MEIPLGPGHVFILYHMFRFGMQVVRSVVFELDARQLPLFFRQYIKLVLQVIFFGLKQDGLPAGR